MMNINFDPGSNPIRRELNFYDLENGKKGFIDRSAVFIGADRKIYVNTDNAIADHYNVNDNDYIIVILIDGVIYISEETMPNIEFTFDDIDYLKWYGMPLCEARFFSVQTSKEGEKEIYVWDKLPETYERPSVDSMIEGDIAYTNSECLLVDLEGYVYVDISAGISKGPDEIHSMSITRVGDHYEVDADSIKKRRFRRSNLQKKTNMRLAPVSITMAEHQSDNGLEVIEGIKRYPLPEELEMPDIRLIPENENRYIRPGDLRITNAGTLYLLTNVENSLKKNDEQTLRVRNINGNIVIDELPPAAKKVNSTIKQLDHEWENLIRVYVLKDNMILDRIRINEEA